MSYIYGRGPVIEALKNNKVDKIYLASHEGSIIKIKAMAKEKKVLISSLSKDRLDKMALGKNHQGVVALVSGYEYKDFQELLDENKDKKEFRLLILDKMEDPHNLGAIARSALFFNFDGIIIPKHREALVNDTVYKTSQGAVDNVNICQVTNLSQTIEKLKKAGFWIYAALLEGDNIKDVDFSGKVAIIIGNEGKGISDNLIKASDFKVKIPNLSEFDSLNASVAAGIIMYEVIR